VVSACSATCGDGVEYVSLEVISPAVGNGAACPAPTPRPCKVKECCVNGHLRSQPGSLGVKLLDERLAMGPSTDNSTITSVFDRSKARASAIESLGCSNLLRLMHDALWLLSLVFPQRVLVGKGVRAPR
jgi:hypothetical protein